MKFARYLEENVVVEWRRAYINYRGLKKVIKRVNTRYRDRTSLELSKQSSNGSSSIRGITTAAVEGLRRRQRRISGASHSNGEEAASDTPIWSPTSPFSPSSKGIPRVTYGAATLDDDPERQRESRLPQVTLEGTGLSLTNKPSDEASQQPNSGESDESTIVLPTSAFTSKNVDGESGTAPAQRADEQPALNRLQMPPTMKTNERGKTKTKKKQRKKEQEDSTLNDLIRRTFDQQERLFFDALDSELARIVSFYNTREEDMAKRYEMLARQLEELADHRREYKATHAHDGEGSGSGGGGGGGERWGADLSMRFSHLVAPIAQPAQTLKRASVQLRRDKSPVRTTVQQDGGGSQDEGDKRRAEALSKMLNAYGGTLSETEDAELRKANRLAAMSHDPERYKAARKKLKTAVLEYYRGLEILKNYKILNRTGFAKILKKFEKTTEVHCADAYYRAHVAPSVLVASETVEKLLKGTEEIYTAYFEHGNRKRALERLRVHTGTGTEQTTNTHHFSAARSGFYLGVAVCATAAGLVSAMHEDTHRSIPLWDQLMRTYGALFLPTLFTLLFGLNLAVWHHARVNAIFIFEWDVRHVLDFHQFFELPAFFMLLLSLAFWVSFLNPFPDAIAPTTWPLVWLVAVVVMILNPLPVVYYHARRWFVKSMLRVLHGGLLSGVEFRDFFLGDELNSLNWSISMLWFIGCEYKHNWRYPNQCDPNGTFWTAVLLAIPAFLRFVQCFRRWRDSRFQAYLHLVNAGKYSTTILNSFFYINWRYHGSVVGGRLALWCVFGCIYSIYTSAWDIMMDWSLLQRNARYPFLRNELVYESYWPFYYWAIVTDVILRFGWTIYLIPGPASPLLRIFIIALLESLRRWQWNFLRLENEHLGNVDMYRVSREVPLPYHTQTRRTPLDEEDELEAAGETKGQKLQEFRTPKAMMRLLRRGQRDGGQDDRERDGDRTGEWQPNHYPPTQSINTTQAADASRTATTTKGKTTANEDDSLHRKGRQGSSNLAKRIRDTLVPDHGGMAGINSSLAGQAVAHGETARDYEPRRGEVIEQNSDDDDDDDDDDEIDGGVDDKQTSEHKKTS